MVISSREEYPMHKLSTALPKVVVRKKKKTTLMGVGTSLTYGCPGSVLLPLLGPLGPQVERAESFRCNLVVLRAWRGCL